MKSAVMICHHILNFNPMKTVFTTWEDIFYNLYRYFCITPVMNSLFRWLGQSSKHSSTIQWFALKFSGLIVRFSTSLSVLQLSSEVTSQVSLIAENLSLTSCRATLESWFWTTRVWADQAASLKEKKAVTKARVVIQTRSYRKSF